ncbi:outer membrane protein assembly factor BamB family protein [Coleofasciculus sp.]|uniref:outer membrane protein assembly factor BamB family protein n=1 Tax=Coleofasciculus sp. TaxID=3100458 RepID=UPI0039FA7283
MNIAFSVPLPFRKVKSLVVSNNRVLVSDSDQMVAITAEGQMLWHLRFEHPIGKMVVAPSGDIVGICDGGKQLTVRSPNTGELKLSIPVNSFVYAIPAVTKSHLIYHGWDNQLNVFYQTGELCWSAPTDKKAIWIQPVVVEDWVFTSTQGVMAYAVDDGSKRGSWDELSPSEEILTMRRADAKRIVVGYGINQLFILNKEHCTVCPWILPSGYRIFMDSLTVFESPDSELTLIATAGVDGKKAVVSVTESGEMLWEYPISKTPVAISVGTAGQVYIAQSPTLDEWDKYKDFCEFSCFLLELSATGEELWKWEAPAPITSLLAVADDAIYVVCDGNLMRLGRR